MAHSAKRVRKRRPRMRRKQNLAVFRALMHFPVFPGPVTPVKPKTFGPKIIIFDVDGVLVDVRGSFHKTTLDTVRFFTGKRVTRKQLQDWKGRSGFNDDWKLSTAWVKSLGGAATYEQVK